MRNTIRNIAIAGCLALPFGLWGADGALGDKSADKGAKADHALAAKIQRSVATDEGLSPTARKVDVTVQKGVVTLRGSVTSDEESQAIEGKAESFVIQETPVELVDSGEIHNELVVSPN